MGGKLTHHCIRATGSKRYDQAQLCPLSRSCGSLVDTLAGIPEPTEQLLLGFFIFGVAVFSPSCALSNKPHISVAVLQIKYEEIL